MAQQTSSTTQDRSPLLVVVSGASGAGKDAVLKQLQALGRPWHFVVTATTRPRRESEVDGVDYIFLTSSSFNEMLARDELLEHAEVYGNMYGVPRQQARDALARGQDVIMKLDVQGAATVKRLAPEAVFIFLAPASMGELRSRLKGRHTELGTDLDLRIEAAQQEMQRLDLFDYCVVNRDQHLDEAVACVDAIIVAEHCRVPPRRVSV